MSTRLETTDLGRRRYHLTALQIEAMIEAGIFPLGTIWSSSAGSSTRWSRKSRTTSPWPRLRTLCDDSCPQVFTFVKESRSAWHNAACLSRMSWWPLVGPDLSPATSEARDVVLLVEVCRHSRKADYHDKYRRYAAAGVPAYWIVDLHRRCVQVFTDRRRDDRTIPDRPVRRGSASPSCCSADRDHRREGRAAASM